MFDTSSKREKQEIAKVFFAALNDKMQSLNGVEPWFDPELGVTYEGRKQTHQLLAADMLAWTIATLRARQVFFPKGRFVEVFRLAKIFVPTDHVKLGYTTKDTLAQWEKDKLKNAANANEGSV